MLECEVCGGQLSLLGILGSLGHLRCRDCGVEVSVPYSELPGDCAECGGPLAEYEIERGYEYCGHCRGIDEDMLPGRIGR